MTDTQTLSSILYFLMIPLLLEDMLTPCVNTWKTEMKNEKRRMKNKKLKIKNQRCKMKYVKQKMNNERFKTSKDKLPQKMNNNKE